MSREGWDCKSGARVLGLKHESGFPAAADPAFRKVATLMLHDARKTWAEINFWLGKVEQDLIRQKLEAGDLPSQRQTVAGRR